MLCPPGQEGCGDKGKGLPQRSPGAGARPGRLQNVCARSHLRTPCTVSLPSVQARLEAPRPRRPRHCRPGSRKVVAPGSRPPPLSWTDRVMHAPWASSHVEGGLKPHVPCGRELKSPPLLNGVCHVIPSRLPVRCLVSLILFYFPRRTGLQGGSRRPVSHPSLGGVGSSGSDSFPMFKLLLFSLTVSFVLAILQRADPDPLESLCDWGTTSQCVLAGGDSRGGSRQGDPME